jgi:hypothetical protein
MRFRSSHCAVRSKKKKKPYSTHSTQQDGKDEEENRKRVAQQNQPFASRQKTSPLPEFINTPLVLNKTTSVTPVNGSKTTKKVRQGKKIKYRGLPTRMVQIGLSLQSNMHERYVQFNECGVS